MRVLLILSGFLTLSSSYEFGKFNESREGNETIDSSIGDSEKGC